MEQNLKRGYRPSKAKYRTYTTCPQNMNEEQKLKSKHGTPIMMLKRQKNQLGYYPPNSD